MPRSRLDPAIRRELLVEAAAACFAAHGPGVSTRQIARAAGVSEALLFHYFPDKESLWFAVASRAGTFAARLRGQLSGEASARERLAQICAAYAEVREDERQLIVLLLGAALRDDPLGARVREAHVQMVGELGAALATWGFSAPGAAAEALATALIGAFQLDLLMHHRDEPARWPARAAAFAEAWLGHLLPLEAPHVQRG